MSKLSSTNGYIDIASILTMENGSVSSNENVTDSQARVGNNEAEQPKSQDGANAEMEVDVETLWISLTSQGSTRSIGIPVNSGFSAFYGLTAKHTVNLQTASGHASGNSGDGNPPIVISNHEMYSTPPVHELNLRIQQTGSYAFSNLTVGHMHHGTVQFLGCSDFKSMAIQNVVDLSKVVAFNHGGIECDSKIQGPKLITLFNITREDFGKKSGALATPTDEELVKIVKELGNRMKASFSQYNEAQRLWLFLVGVGDEGDTGNY